MKCWDCERDPCICREAFPFARLTDASGNIYDHNGGLLVSAEEMKHAPEPIREYDACPWCDGTGGEPMAPCRRCNGDGLIRRAS